MTGPDGGGGGVVIGTDVGEGVGVGDVGKDIEEEVEVTVTEGDVVTGLGPGSGMTSNVGKEEVVEVEA